MTIKSPSATFELKMLYLGVFVARLQLPPMGYARDLAYLAGAVVTSPIWGFNLIRTGKWRTDWAGRLGTVTSTGLVSDHQTLLIHGVSVGEVNLIRGLVKAFEDQHPEVGLVIGATTNTGFARAQKLYGQRHAIVRYPLDWTFAVGRFLDTLKPDCVAVVELEVWPNFIEICQAREIPVCVINGRLSERSFRGYRRIRPLIRNSFAALSAAAVQTEQYAARFGELGTPAERISVLDTMKWDGATIVDDIEGSDTLATDLGVDRSKPLIVAGSTGPGEERLLIDTMPDGVQLLIAPRKPERFDDVADLLPAMTRRTQGKPDGKSPGPVFLLDTIGELGQAYALADVALVGRSFLGMYGSDPTEPIALGKPTIIGSHHSDFADMVRALKQARGLIVTDQPMAEARRLLDDPSAAGRLAEAGRAVIRQRQGATQRHVDLLMTMLEAHRA